MGSLEKEMNFFRKIFANFQKDSKWILCFSKRSKSFSGLCKYQNVQILSFFGKMMFFLSKNSLKVFRSTMLGIFYVDGASDFEIAWEFSKQSFFGFFGEIDFVFERIASFFSKNVLKVFRSIKVGTFFRECLSNCPIA